MALEVPPKKEVVVYAPLTAKQEALYTAVVNKTIAKVLGVEKVMSFSTGDVVYYNMKLEYNILLEVLEYDMKNILAVTTWFEVGMKSPPWCVQEEHPVDLTPSGRPKRRNRRAVSYKETDEDTPHDLEKYLEEVQKEHEQR